MSSLFSKHVNMHRKNKAIVYIHKPAIGVWDHDPCKRAFKKNRVIWCIDAYFGNICLNLFLILYSLYLPFFLLFSFLFLSSLIFFCFLSCNSHFLSFFFFRFLSCNSYFLSFLYFSPVFCLVIFTFFLFSIFLQFSLFSTPMRGKGRGRGKRRGKRKGEEKKVISKFTPNCAMFQICYGKTYSLTVLLVDVDVYLYLLALDVVYLKVNCI